MFSGAIGENAPLIRSRICSGLRFLGIELNNPRNAKTAGVISTDASKVTVRVIRTIEELMVARSVCRALELGLKRGIENAGWWPHKARGFTMNHDGWMGGGWMGGGMWLWTVIGVLVVVLLVVLISKVSSK